MADGARPRGRPTDYREEFNEIAYKHALAGAVDEEIAEVLGIDRSTLYDWKNRFPDFADAIKSGKAPANAEVVYSLFKNATGYRERTEKPTKDGPVEVEEYFPPNVAAQIFWLKNRLPEQWRDRIEPNKLEIEITYKRDAENFGRVIEQAADANEGATLTMLLENHPPEVREHLQLVLQDVPEDELQEVYDKSIDTILAAAHRGTHEETTRELADPQKLPDVAALEAGYMANLDDPEDEEKQNLQDAVERVKAHNEKVRARGKK